ncbi:MAG: peptidoglycan DD-metalloendopeptidase family protein [Dongiaceae bacterium]
MGASSHFRRLARALPALAVAAWAIGAAPAADDDARLREVERGLVEGQDRAQALHAAAEALAAEVRALQGELVAAAKAAQDQEERLTALESELTGLEAGAASAGAELVRRQAQMAATLAALQRLSLQPPQALMLGPRRPVDTVRSAMLLRVAVPAVAARARGLRQEIEALRRMQDDIRGRREEMAGAVLGLQAERDRLGALVERKKGLQQTTATEQRAAAERVAALAGEARDMRDLLTRLAPPTAQPAATLRLERPADIRPFPTERAGLTPPARGKLVGRYGEARDTDLYSRGVTIETRPQAQVVAPYDGQIAFRGPFRGYGEILIIEHGGGYHTLLAGLGRIDAVVGQWLLGGEPVGVMGPSAGGSPKLYVELRRGGQPINPAPWLETPDSKVE